VRRREKRNAAISPSRKGTAGSRDTISISKSNVTSNALNGEFPLQFSIKAPHFYTLLVYEYNSNGPLAQMAPHDNR